MYCDDDQSLTSSVLSGYHRYLFLVYKQPSKLTFDEPRLTLKYEH